MITDCGYVHLRPHVLENLLFHLSESDEVPAPTPLECVAAWLWSHSDGTEKERERMLEYLGLEKIPQPQGNFKIRKKQ